MKTLGYLAVASAAILWAVGGTFARVLFERGASPVELTEARAWIAAVGVGAVVYLGRRRRRVKGRAAPPGIGERLGRYGLVLMVAFGLAIAAANVTYYLALSLLPVAVAIVVQYTGPGLVVLWKSVAGRQRPSARVVVALVLAFFGVVLISEAHRALAGAATTLHPVGVALALVSAVAFAAYILLGEVVGGALGPERAVFGGFVVASVFWIIVQTVRGTPETLLDVSFLLPILFLGVFTTIFPFLLFLWGLRIVSASPAGIVSTLEPVSAALLALWWLGQTLTPLQLVGAAAVVVGIGVVQSERPEAPEVLLERTAVE